MKKTAIAIIGLLLILFYCAGCGPSYHLRRAEYHIKKAELKGARVKSDTVFVTVEKPVYIPEVKTDTLFKSEPGDTVRIEKERLKIKYVNLPGDSVFISGECEADTVEVEIKVPVTVTKEIKAGYSLWDIIILAIACLATGYMVRWLVKRG